MSFPTDVLPLHLMLDHKRRALNTCAGLDTVLLVNWPPWVGAESLSQNRKLELFHDSQHAYENARIAAVSYNGLTDARFLSPFFTLLGGEWSLQDLVEGLGPEPKALSNFMGMLAFLQQCLDASDGVELCAYFDSDTFVHNNGTRSLLELAHGIFESHPKLVSLTPPGGCQHEHVLANGTCRVRPRLSFQFPSSRYIIMNRTRLRAVLPLPANVTMFGRRGDGFPYFERTWGEALGRDRHAQMMCGDEAFVLHPPDPRHRKWAPDMISLEGMLRALSDASRPASQALDDNFIERGAKELIQRLEQGRFQPDQSLKWLRQGRSVVTDRLLWCEEMLASWERIATGEAW